MINYSLRNKGMTITRQDKEYVINHDVFKVIELKDLDDKLMIHIQNNVLDTVINPYKDYKIDLKVGDSVKVAYITLENGTIVCYGYEPSNEVVEVKESNKQYVQNEIDIDRYIADLKIYYEKIEDENVKGFVYNTLKSEWNKFITYPASTSVHHNIKGGLLQHTVGVVKNAYNMAVLYADVDMDLVLTGAILHDFCKIYEYTETGSVSNTGMLKDHLSMMSAYIEKNCTLEDEKFKEHLQHIMLSHHGRLEWGSPKQPQTLEAMVVHLADYIDSQLCIYHNALKKLEYGESVNVRPLGHKVIQTKLNTSSSYVN